MLLNVSSLHNQSTTTGTHRGRTWVSWSVWTRLCWWCEEAGTPPQLKVGLILLRTGDLREGIRTWKKKEEMLIVWRTVTGLRASLLDGIERLLVGRHTSLKERKINTVLGGDICAGILAVGYVWEPWISLRMGPIFSSSWVWAGAAVWSMGGALYTQDCTPLVAASCVCHAIASVRCGDITCQDSLQGACSLFTEDFEALVAFRALWGAHICLISSMINASSVYIYYLFSRLSLRIHI